MMKKKNYYAFGVGVLLLSTVACGGGAKDNPTAEAPTPANNTETTAPAETAPTAQLASVDLSNLKFDARTRGPEKSAEQKELEEAHDIIQNIDENETILGYWTGAFGTNKITLIIEKFGGTTIEGHSVCAGNYRKITGTAEETSTGVYKCVMNEPGDDKYDGKFEFTLNANDVSLKGKWAPFQNTVEPKEYDLSRRLIPEVTDMEICQYPMGSASLMTEDDIMDFIDTYGVDELRILRNEIYARHGYSFKNKEMRAHFDKQDWYLPSSIDVRDDLTDNEVKNIDLIVEYEEYFDESMDMFGR